MDQERAAVPQQEAEGDPRTGGPLADGVVEDVLAAALGSMVHLEPVLGPAGEVVDFRFAAASPDAIDIAGRRGADLLGRTVLVTYPGVAGSDLWHGYLRAFRSGVPYDGELAYEEVAAGIPRLSRFRIRAVPSRGGLVVSWTRLDNGERDQARQALMRRLGRTGWVDQDLVRGGVTWSAEVYSIVGRSPSLGPLTLEQLAAHAEPDGEDDGEEDGPSLLDSIRRLTGAGDPIDRTIRVALPGSAVRHLRLVAEAQLDAHGDPVEVHGFFQDLTTAKHTERLLLEHRQAAIEQRSLLAAERDLAARLQDTLLPVPHQVLHLGGLTVDVAYRPVQAGLRLGGDWYSALELPDGSVLLVVGDVAGHGLDAVAAMALLRFTAKGMAITGTPLPAVLARLNTLLLHTAERPGGTATMIMGCYRPEDSRLTWVQAGHLPPLLIREGAARFLAPPAGVLLGATADPRYEEATLELLPGDELLLYTDGLIENRGESLDESMERLARTAPEHTGSPRFLDGLVPALVVSDSRSDDICAVHISR
ncbi:PP2C family protein-serine/threonine phosphatase [Kitasatospora sp. NPDC006697]|uniref:PP2C family protein-serine/threonine phosphatase n=1 Tax=Kitasatospora sp. NPDC006697 TaxID=3364020 RepID=UPI00369FFF19